MIRQATEDEYFRGHKADKPHPHMPATGTEGMCELCRDGRESPFHQAFLKEQVGDSE